MDIDNAFALLSRMGYRITRQRRVVVELILQSACLQSAEDIYEKCREVDDSISFPTIYRTLDMLVDAELVRRLHFGHGRCWYEPFHQDGHHHHLICRDCGARVPIASCPEQMIKEEAQRNQFKVLDHQFEILGICKECQGKK